MGYKKELLQLNVEKFALEDVVDFDAIHDKWEFLKFDTFNWNNHLPAKEKELVSEDDSIVYYEHSSSIEKEISNVARIFSISLNQCYKRKIFLEQLQFNSLKYDSVLNSLHFLIMQYDSAIKEVDKEIESQPTVGHEYDNNSVVINAFRDNVEKSRQNFYYGLENYKIAFTKMIAYLKTVKTETEKYYSALQQAIELTGVRLQTELEIKNRAQEKMYSMRTEYLHSVARYARFGSTVPIGDGSDGSQGGSDATTTKGKEASATNEKARSNA